VIEVYVTQRYVSDY